MRYRLGLAAAALALLAPGLLGSGHAESGELRDLRNVDELKARFNADLGQPRLVLLLSPT